ncbi:lipoprotein [Mesoplasma chauliocola]|uniref:lipoprotein n=1 Tax=Mesoplasma chauliocola TaxID=216427 RepID=UPI0004844DBF|nr:lipoprotein [Mesoplasma chauliocola]
MKKLIAILGATTLTASSASVVISCGNSTTQVYSDFVELANATRPTFDENGNVTKPGSTLIYYIGAKNNLSSKSFEFALKETTGLNQSASLDEAFEKMNTQTNDSSTLAYNFQNIGGAIKTNTNTQDGLKYAQTEVSYNKKRSLWYFENATNNIVFSEQAKSSKIEIHGTTLDEVSDLWTDKTTSKILKDWITPSIARMEYSTQENREWDNSKNGVDKELIQAINENISSRVTQISQSKGPLFLVIQNGEFAGYFDGFETYSDVKDETANQEIAKGASKWNQNVRADFTRMFISSIQNSLVEGSMFTNLYGQSGIKSEFSYSFKKDNIWKWNHWDGWVANDSDTDAEGETTDPGTGEGEDEQTNNFTYNLNNY